MILVFYDFELRDNSLETIVEYTDSFSTEGQDPHQRVSCGSVGSGSEIHR